MANTPTQVSQLRPDESFRSTDDLQNRMLDTGVVFTKTLHMPKSVFGGEMNKIQTELVLQELRTSLCLDGPIYRHFLRYVSVLIPYHLMRILGWYIPEDLNSYGDHGIDGPTFPEEI